MLKLEGLLVSGKLEHHYHQSPMMIFCNLIATPVGRGEKQTKVATGAPGLSYQLL